MRERWSSGLISAVRRWRDQLLASLPRCELLTSTHLAPTEDSRARTTSTYLLPSLGRSASAGENGQQGLPAKRSLARLQPEVTGDLDTIDISTVHAASTSPGRAANLTDRTVNCLHVLLRLEAASIKHATLVRSTSRCGASVACSSLPRLFYLASRRRLQQSSVQAEGPSSAPLFLVETFQPRRRLQRFYRSAFRSYVKRVKGRKGEGPGKKGYATTAQCSQHQAYRG
jgi:hypothetical protein